MRIWPLVGGAAVLAGAAGITGVVVSGSSADDSDSGSTTDTTVARTLAEVTRTDLARTEELDGVDRSRHPDGTRPGRRGHVDRAASRRRHDRARRGRRRGGRLADHRPARSDSRCGARSGRPSRTASDVLQVEYVLASIGYAEEHDMTVDEDWTSATTEAVEAFQADHGQDDDGEIEVGEVVFIDGPVRVDGVDGVLGEQAAARPASR